jgi:hypothetical protein
MVGLGAVNQSVEHDMGDMNAVWTVFARETLRDAGQQQRAPDRHGRQIQRRMLAMMTICASQPAVKVSVRAAGMPAE